MKKICMPGTARALAAMYAERDALARAGRSLDQGVAGIGHVEIETQRRAAGGRAVAERRRVRRIVRTRIDRQPRPDAGERHDVDQVAGADQRLAHVVPAVDRNRAEPGLDWRWRSRCAGRSPCSGRP